MRHAAALAERCPPAADVACAMSARRCASTLTIAASDSRAARATSQRASQTRIDAAINASRHDADGSSARRKRSGASEAARMRTMRGRARSVRA